MESFGSRVRDELLGVELLSCLAEAKVMVEDWREDYNERRPHSALAMSAPARFARSWREDREKGQQTTLGDPSQALSECAALDPSPADRARSRAWGRSGRAHHLAALALRAPSARW